MKASDIQPVVFTPDNEPYLGRSLLAHFDEMICVLMEHNTEKCASSFRADATDLQKMASQVIAQATSLVLSVRELIRQGYLFGGHVLLRGLVERVAILLYLHHYPDDISLWNEGWTHKNAPSLSKMFEKIQEKQGAEEIIPGFKLTGAMNSLIHGKPDSAPWNMVAIGEDGLGHAISKILARPDLCDELCADILPWTVVLLGMIEGYFPSSTQME